MKRPRQGVPAVPGTTPLASDVSMPPRVDEATAEVATDAAEDLATGAIATADANAAAPAEPLVPVPGTVPLPADQMTPMLSASAVVEASGVGRTIETDAQIALRTLQEQMASLGVRIDLFDARLEAIEDRLEPIDGIVLTIDDGGKVVAADADLPAERLAELRRDVLGLRADMSGVQTRHASVTHRAFPVSHEVLQDGRKVRPNSRDRVRLSEAEHGEALAGGIVTLAWGDGDPVEDA